MSKPYVVFLNGPPGSGKDYAAETLVEHAELLVSSYKFSAPIKDMLGTLLEVSNGVIEKTKHLKNDLYGVTTRQMLIDLSEKYMKPCYGKDIFGRICATRMAEEIQNNDTYKEEQPDIFVISDSGFDYEAKSVLQLFGNENALLIRLHRDGHSFKGDSRSYIELDDVRTVDINNDGSTAFGSKLIDVVKNWIKERETDGTA
jgi:hypothetical protein